MTRHLSRCAVTAAAAAVVATSLVVAPPASADVFHPDETELSADTYVYSGFGDTGPCSFDGTESARPGRLVENGSGGFSRATVQGTLTADGVEPSTSEVDVELRSSTRLRSEGDRPRRITMNASGTSSVTGDAAETCDAEFVADVDLDSQFTVTEPTLITVRADVVGIDGHIDVQEVEAEPDEFGDRDNIGGSTILDLEYLASRSQAQVELTPGRWDVEIHTDVDTFEAGAATVDPELDVDIDFSLPGERREVRGAGERFVSMPESRDCEAGTVTPTLTTDAADAAAVRRVELFVDGRRTTARSRPAAGEEFPLTLQRRSPATVRAFVVLDPLKKGAPTRQRTVTASYQNCFR